MRSCFRHPVRAVILSCGILCGCGPAKYPINLSPPYQAGQKFSLVADATQDTLVEATLTPKGAIASEIKKQEAHMAIRFEGNGTVLAVFPNGNVQKIAVAAKVLTAMKNGQSLEGLPALGANIVVEWTDQGRAVSVNGKSVGDDAARAIGEVLNVGDLFGFTKSSQTDQDAFGPHAPVSVGGTWAINSDAMGKTLKAALETDLGSVNGTMTLDSLKGEGDDRVFTLSGNLSVNGIQPKLPADVKLDSATIAGTLAEQIPATTAKGTLKQSAHLSVRQKERADSEALKVRIDVSSDVKNSREVTFH